MSGTHRTIVRIAALAGATAISAAALTALAPSAEASTGSWTCANAYSPSSGARVGKACFNGTLAQVCDLSKDGRTVWGSFSSSAGPRQFKDNNGSASGCTYQRFSGIGSVSSWAQ